MDKALLFGKVYGRDRSAMDHDCVEEISSSGSNWPTNRARARMTFTLTFDLIIIIVYALNRTNKDNACDHRIATAVTAGKVHSRDAELTPCKAASVVRRLSNFEITQKGLKPPHQTTTSLQIS